MSRVSAEVNFGTRRSKWSLRFCASGRGGFARRGAACEAGRVALRAVYLLAKEPVPGAVKTRLLPTLTAEQAADCHRAFVRDSLDRLCATADADTVVTLAVSAQGQASWLSELAAKRAVAVVEQGTGSLGDRMERVLQDGLQNHQIVVLVGADVPDLPLSSLRSALAVHSYVSEPSDAAEGRPRVVLGPSLDGGYYLVGANGLVPDLFRIGAAWGSARVLEATQDRLRQSGVPYRLVPPWPDVDTGEDLRQLADRLLAGGPPLPNTRAALNRLRRDGVRL